MNRPRRFVRLENLLGKRVATPDGRRVGRIEEVRAERRGDAYEVTEFHLGTGALLERLSIVQRLRRRRPRMYVARWDQIDITTERPQLTCPVEELEMIT